MKQKDFDFSGSSRSNIRAKRRKTNLVLNSLIAIVILLIIIVSFTIFFGDGDKASTTASGSTKDSTEQSNDNNADDSETAVEDTTDEDTEDAAEDTETESDTDTEDTSNEDEENSSEDDSELETNTDENVVSEGGSDSNVMRTITNPDWQPIGTSQTGEHAPVYDSNSIDWQEMERAIQYGTGLDQGNMTLWFLGRNKDAENQSVATVSSKDNSVNYRVYIEWVDGQGWKPIKVEELYENDKR